MNAPTHRVKWRLVYHDDSIYIDEPEGDASIRLARPGASNLLIMELLPDGRRVAHWRIPLREPRANALFGPGGNFLTGSEVQLQPVFYRVRGVEIMGARANTEAGTYGLVFGAGRDADDGVTCNARLFYWRPGLKEPISCPERFFDQRMLELQISQPEPGPIEVA